MNTTTTTFGADPSSLRSDLIILAGCVQNALAKVETREWLVLGQLLEEAFLAGLWASWGFSSWERYVEAELKMKLGTVSQLRRAFSFLTRNPLKDGENVSYATASRLATAEARYPSDFVRLKTACFAGRGHNWLDHEMKLLRATAEQGHQLQTRLEDQDARNLADEALAMLVERLGAAGVADLLVSLAVD